MYILRGEKIQGFQMRLVHLMNGKRYHFGPVSAEMMVHVSVNLEF